MSWSRAQSAPLLALLMVLQISPDTALLVSHRMHVPHTGVACSRATTKCQTEYELAMDLRFVKEMLCHQLRQTRSLTKESLAIAMALTNANPSDPDPANDIELWSGTFEVLSTKRRCASPDVRPRCHCACVLVSVDRHPRTSVTTGAP